MTAGPADSATTLRNAGGFRPARTSPVLRMRTERPVLVAFRRSPDTALSCRPAVGSGCEEEIAPASIGEQRSGVGVSERVAHCGAGADRARLDVSQDDAEARARCGGAAESTGCAAGPGDHHIAAPQRCAGQGGQPRVGPRLLAGLVVAVPVDQTGAAAGDAYC